MLPQYAVVATPENGVTTNLQLIKELFRVRGAAREQPLQIRVVHGRRAERALQQAPKRYTRRRDDVLRLEPDRGRGERADPDRPLCTCLRRAEVLPLHGKKTVDGRRSSKRHIWSQALEIEGNARRGQESLLDVVLIGE